MTTDAFDELELVLRAKAAQLTEPRPDECLTCFVARMLRSFGCDNTLRWAEHFRNARAPQATGLSQRLGEMGGYCDCEVLLNCYAPVGADHGADLPDPSCAGVGRASVRPCAAWRRVPW